MTFCFALPLILQARQVRALEGDLTSMTVIARVGSREIHYGEVQANTQSFADLKRMGYGQGMLDALRRTMETSNLTALIDQQVLSATLARRPISLIPSEQEIETRSARLFKEMFGRETFTQKDADRHNKNLTGVLRLLEAWQDDHDKGEALYKKEFASTISRHEWAELKKRYPRARDLEKLREQTPHITVDEQTEGIHRMALTQLRQEKLVKGLVREGVIDSEREYDAWLDRQRKEITTWLHPRFAWPEPPKPAPTPKPQSRLSRLTSKLRRKKSD